MNIKIYISFLSLIFVCFTASAEESIDDCAEVPIAELDACYQKIIDSQTGGDVFDLDNRKEGNSTEYNTFFYSIFDSTSWDTLNNDFKKFIDQYLMEQQSQSFLFDLLGKEMDRPGIESKTYFSKSEDKICIEKCFSYSDFHTLMYEYLQKYQPISYQAIEDGSEEHFKAMRDFLKPIRFGLNALPAAEDIFTVPNILDRYITRETIQELKDICVNVFDDKYIELQENINSIFPNVNACSYEEVYNAIAIYLYAFSNIGSADSREEIVAEIKEYDGVAISLDAFSYKNLNFIKKEFLNGFPNEDIKIKCLTRESWTRGMQGRCGQDNLADVLIENVFFNLYQAARATLGNEFVWISPKTYDKNIENYVYFFLFDNVSSKDDITRKIKSLPNDQFLIQAMLWLSETAVGKSDRKQDIQIYRFYQKILDDDPDAVDKIHNPRNYMSQEDLDREKYTEVAYSYQFVKKCYEIRSSYEVVYLTKEELNLATNSFNKKTSGLKVSSEVRQEIDAQQRKEASKMFFSSNYLPTVKDYCTLNMMTFR